MTWIASMTALCSCLNTAVADGKAGTDESGHPLEVEIRQVLHEQATSARCDAEHFIYGVGSIDGSWVERFFYVAGAGDAPTVSVRLRGELPQFEPPEQIPDDIAPIPFVLELQVPRARHALPSGTAWVVSGDGWQTSLRFKYTSRFGEIQWENCRWRIAWQGYRRPLLPTAIASDSGTLCELFAGP